MAASRRLPFPYTRVTALSSKLGGSSCRWRMVAVIKFSYFHTLIFQALSLVAAPICCMKPELAALKSRWRRCSEKPVVSTLATFHTACWATAALSPVMQWIFIRQRPKHLKSIIIVKVLSLFMKACYATSSRFMPDPASTAPTAAGGGKHHHILFRQQWCHTF